MINDIEFVGDFETSVYEGQEDTEVWASALVSIFKDPSKYTSKDVKVFTSIDDTYTYLQSLRRNVKVYYHNLKFDGEFWLSWLKRNNFKFHDGFLDEDAMFKNPKDMACGEYSYLISDMGQWYEIKIKTGYGRIITIWDSLKLLPFSVKTIGKAFDTKHKKGLIEYVGERHAGGTITNEEKEYISNDVLVVAEALALMKNEGHNKMTIGSCCLQEFKWSTALTPSEYNEAFPRLEDIKTPDAEEYGAETADEYIRKAYRGGWCYVKEGEEGKIQKDGCVADVNSLYPSVMHSDSGCKYPQYNPHFWKGNFIPEKAKGKWKTYFIRFRCSFEVKENYLPFVQIKKDARYNGNEMLKSSRPKYKGKYIRTTEDSDSIVIMTMASTEYELFLKHYNVSNFEILDGVWFVSYTGIFDDYINTYRKIKQESKGAKRTLAKLFLNNLYGKMATSIESSFKHGYLDENEVMHYENIHEENKPAGFIAIGAMITANARVFTITAAQKNYENFLYADTDSIHCKCQPSELIGVPLHDTEFCHWKIENTWDEAIFIRQKTYIEKDGDDILVKCAGMPEVCKEQVRERIRQSGELGFFNHGFKVKGKLMPTRIKGGIVLKPTTFEIK